MRCPRRGCAPRPVRSSPDRRRHPTRARRTPSRSTRGRRPSRMRRQGPRRPHPSPQEGRSAGTSRWPREGKEGGDSTGPDRAWKEPSGRTRPSQHRLAAWRERYGGGAPGATRRATRRATRSKLWPHQGALVRTQASRSGSRGGRRPVTARDWVHGADGKSSHRGDGLREVRTRSRGAPFVVLP